MGAQVGPQETVARGKPLPAQTHHLQGFTALCHGPRSLPIPWPSSPPSSLFLPWTPARVPPWTLYKSSISSQSGLALLWAQSIALGCLKLSCFINLVPLPSLANLTSPTPSFVFSWRQYFKVKISAIWASYWVFLGLSHVYRLLNFCVIFFFSC